MNKKLFLIFALAFLLVIPTVLAVRVDYSPNEKGVENMKAEIKDTILFGLIQVGEQGTMELKSHKSPTEVLKVGTGWQVTMIYETNFGQAHKDALGDVTFIDMRTGLEVDKEYKFVYWGTEERERDTYSCLETEMLNGTLETNCLVNGTETYNYEGWLDYNSKDLPKGKITLGLMTNVGYKDYVDGIWEVQGKKIDKHASWTSALDVDLVSYYKFDQTSGNLIDSLGINNFTASGTLYYSQQGIVDKAIAGDGSTGKFTTTNNNLISTDGTYTYNSWFKSNGDSSFAIFAGRDAGSNGYSINYGITGGAGVFSCILPAVVAVDYTVAMDTDWHMISCLGNSSGTYLFYDGEVRVVGIAGTPIAPLTGVPSFFAEHVTSGYSGYFDGNITEFGFWNRSLTQSEITQLYNGGAGISYSDIINDGLEVILNSPANNTNFSNTNIQFNVTVTDDFGVANVSLYIDGELDQTNTSGYNGTYIFDKALSTGEHNWSILAYDNDSNSNQSETRFLNITVYPPEIELSYPANNLIVSEASQNFYAYVTDDINLVNVSFYWNGVLDQTNSSGLNATNYSFSKTLTEGSQTWYIKAFDNDSYSTDSATRTITLDSTLPVINITSPVSSYDYLYENYPLELNFTTIDDNLDSCWYVYDNDKEFLSFGNYTGVLSSWNIINGTITGSGSADNLILINQEVSGEYFLDMDAVSTNGLEISDFSSSVPNCIEESYSTKSEYLTSSVEQYYACVKDENSRYYVIKAEDINGGTSEFSSYDLNQDVSCSNATLVSEDFNYSQGYNSIGVFANDTVGNIGNETQSWTYKFFEDSITFDSEVLEGSTQDFLLQGEKGSAYSISKVDLIYDSVVYPTIITSSGNLFNASLSKTAESVSTDTNVTFFFKVYFTEGSIVNSSSNNQTILDVGVDDCSSYTNQIFNFTLVDEEEETNFTLIDNESSEIEIELRFYDSDETSEVFNFTQKYTDINPALVCINQPLISDYIVDGIIRYEGTSHAKEFLHFDSFNLTNSSVPKNTTLYDLNLSDSTEFQVSFRDDDGLFVEGVILLFNRKYVSQGVFKTVEGPKTDNNGQTVAHLDERNVIYNIIVQQEGSVIASFENVIPFCEDSTIGLCRINLIESDSDAVFFDYDEEFEISYQAEYNETSREISFTFSSKDSLSKNVTLSISEVGGETLNTQSLETASGTITYTVPLTLGNSTYNALVYVDGEIMEQFLIDGQEKIPYGVFGFVVFFIFLISMFLMFSGSKTMLVVGGIIAFIFAGLLSLTSSGDLGVISGVIWLIVAGVILIYRLNSVSVGGGGN